LVVVQIVLYHSDSSGTALLGGPITSGRITTAQIDSYYTGVVTPLWFPVYFDQPYAQTPGEHLAFTIEGGGVLADGTKDLTFTTLVPEPGMLALYLVGACALLGWRFNRIESIRRLHSG
jgi:hypothetical protein